MRGGAGRPEGFEGLLAPFVWFSFLDEVVGEEGLLSEALAESWLGRFSVSIPRDRDAGGPTETMREPNSTPIVTSCVGENRPSQRRTVSYCKASRQHVCGDLGQMVGDTVLAVVFDVYQTCEAAGKPWEEKEVTKDEKKGKRTLDLPVPESPMQTNFAM